MAPESQVRELLVEYPELTEAVLEGQKLPAKPRKYKPEKIEILFEGVTVSLRHKGRKLLDLTLPSDYEPEVMEMYFDDELLLVQAFGVVLLNRLPQEKGWTTYERN